MVARREVVASSSESESDRSSGDDSSLDSESESSESLSDASTSSQARVGPRRSGRRSGGNPNRAGTAKYQALAPFKTPAGSSNSQWSAREKQFEAFRSGLVTLPLPDGAQRIERARGYSLHIMSVLNWVLPESIFSLPSIANQLQHADDGDDDSDEDDFALILTLGAHVSMFHAPTKRFFGNTWVSPELPVDPAQIKQQQTKKSSALSYVVENALLNFRAYFISDVVDANCVGIVELVAYQKDPDSKVTVKVTGCGWTIVPLFSRIEKGSTGAPPPAFSMEASGHSVNVFLGSPRLLWELAPSEWNAQETLERCKLFYQLVQYEPILSISMFLRRNELVGALDAIPGLKNGNLANIDVGRNPKMLLWEEQDATYEEALSTFVKLASLVPKSIAIEESFELAVVASRVSIHLRQQVESDLIARLKISRRALYDGATTIEGEISARVLKVALHNGRCFRTRQHTVPLKADQEGDDMLRSVSNRTRLKGFVFHPYLALVLVLQFTVHFRLEWPAKLKQTAIDNKQPLPPEEDVVLVTIGSRAVVPSDGKKLFLHDKHHHATALSAQPMVMSGDGQKSTEDAREHRVLHVDLLSGAPCRPYSDNTLYTPPSHSPQLSQAVAALSDASIAYCDIKIEPGEFKGAAATDRLGGEAAPRPASPVKTPSNQVSDTEDKQANGRGAERWAKKLLDKANNNSLLAQVLDTLADSSQEQQPPSVTPLVLPSPPGKPSADSKSSPKKQVTLERVTLLPTYSRSSELSRASKTLLTRYGYMDGINGRDASSSPINQDITTDGRGLPMKKPMSTPAKTVEQELKDVFKANEVRFHLAALRTLKRTESGDAAPPFTATRVYFTFQFYTFAPTRTEPLRLSDAFDNGAGGETKTFLLMREKPADKPSLAIQFEVDTSATLNPLETRQFAEYLLTKNLYVDVWDADSLFLLGTFAIPLHELLRQGAGIKKFQAEVDILEPIDAGNEMMEAGADDDSAATSRLLADDEGVDCRGKAVVARIQLLMSNYGLKGENRLDRANPNANHPTTVGATDDTSSSRSSKKQRVRARPLVESNPELHRLLSQEGFYRTSNVVSADGREQRQRPLRSRDVTDTTTLSAKEISILCDLFRSQKSNAPSRILCDREGKTGLVALFSLHPKPAPTPTDPVKSDAITKVPAKKISAKTPRSTASSEADAKKREAANADRLQRILLTASKHKVALEDAFQHFDTDGDGFLSLAEFISALRSLGDAFADASDDDLVALAASMDANKDGRVDCAEFEAFLTRKQTSKERLDAWRERIKRVIARATTKGVHVHQVFVQLDASGDGKLSLTEFETALKQLGIPVEKDRNGLLSLLAEFDADHDGQISYHEFIQSLGISVNQNRAEVIVETTKDMATRVQEVMKRLEARGVDMDDAFVLFDKDKNGSLSLDEFMSAMNQLLQSDVAASEGSNENVLKSLEREAALAIMKTVNADGDDKIDYKEFLTFCGVSRDRLKQKEEELRRAKLGKAEKKLIKLIVRACASGMQTTDVFQQFDADADGEISLTEFQRCFQRLFQGQEDLEKDDAQQIAARFDHNGDGKISFQEFQSFSEEIVRNQHALLALFMPHTDALNVAANKSSTGILTAQQWKVLCRGQLKLLPKQMTAVHGLATYFSLVDDSGGVNLTELLALVKTVSPTEVSRPTPSKAKTLVEPAAERLKKLLASAKAQGIDLKSSFVHFDADGSGEVTREELRRGLLALGIFNDMNEAELDSLLGELDADSSGRISFREFAAFFQGSDAPSTAGKPSSEASNHEEAVAKLRKLIAAAVDKGLSMESCFRHFDKNQGGKISSKEFVAAMIELGLATQDQQALLQAVAKHLDRDGSGAVDLGEFKQLPTPSSQSEVVADTSTASAPASEATTTPRREAGGVDVHASFAHFDSDGDGSITSDEFVTSLRQLPGFETTPEEEIRSAVVAALDTNASGSISLDEFHAFLSTKSDKEMAKTIEEEKPSIEGPSDGQPQPDRSESVAAAVTTADELQAEAGGSAAVKTTVDCELQSSAPAPEHRKDASDVPPSSTPSTGDANTPTEKPADSTTEDDSRSQSSNKGGVDVVDKPSESSAESPASKTTKIKPPITRASSFTGAARGKPRLGARPSLAATRRTSTDPDSIQAAVVDGSQSAASTTSGDQPAPGREGDEVAAKAAGRARPTRRPSFASARAAASSSAKASSQPATMSNSSVKTDEKTSESSTAATEIAAEVSSSLASLRSLLVAAQKSGVDVHKSFDHFDKDHNGQLTHEEFALGLRELGDEFRALSDEHVAEVTRVLDRDQRGEIRVQDLVAFTNAPASSTAPALAISAAAPTEAQAVQAEEAATQSKTPRSTTSAASAAAARRRSSMSSTASKAPSGVQRRVSNASTAKPPSEQPTSSEGATSSAPPSTSTTTSTTTATAPDALSTSSASSLPSSHTADANKDTVKAPSTPVDDCSYAFNSDPEVRAVELKLRRAAVDAYSRGVLPLRLLSKFLDDDYSTSFKPTSKSKRQRSELLRVEFLQVLMELGFNLQCDQSDDANADNSSRGRYSGCATRMNDHLYARQLDRLSRYRRHTKASEDSRGQKQLLRAATSNKRPVNHDNNASLKRFEEDKQQLLRVLSYYRDGQKKGLVYSLLREQVTTTLSLFPTFAELLFLELPFRNPYSHSERFKIELLLPTDAERARLVDMDVVRSSSEWSFYRRHLPLAFPASSSPMDEGSPVESEMIDGQNEFVIDGHDALRVPLRLRWLDALTSVPTSQQRDDNTSRASGSVPVSVMVKSCSHGHTVALFKLSLTPRPFVCHRVLRFSHPAGSIWRWTLRCPRGAVLVCMDPRVAVETRSDLSGGVDVDGVEGAIVSFKVRIGDYPSLERFHVVVYGDRYLAKVLETWQVRVQARLRVDAHAVAGQRVTSELVIRSPDDPGARRLVQCFTRAKDVANAQFRPSRVFQLAPRAFNRIEMAYCSVGTGVAVTSSDVVLVNLVDVERRELVGAWSVSVTLAPPRVTKTFALQVSAAHGAQKKIAYANPWDVPQVVALRSSHGTRMAPRESELQVPAHGRVFLRLAFFPRGGGSGGGDGAEQEAMYLFINDKPTDENEECLLFHVTYV